LAPMADGLPLLRRGRPGPPRPARWVINRCLSVPLWGKCRPPGTSPTWGTLQGGGGGCFTKALGPWDAGPRAKTNITRECAVPTPAAPTPNRTMLKGRRGSVHRGRPCWRMFLSARQDVENMTPLGRMGSPDISPAWFVLLASECLANSWNRRVLTARTAGSSINLILQGPTMNSPGIASPLVRAGGIPTSIWKYPYPVFSKRGADAGGKIRCVPL